jgi:hypothetical protein
MFATDDNSGRCTLHASATYCGLHCQDLARHSEHRKLALILVNYHNGIDRFEMIALHVVCYPLDHRNAWSHPEGVVIECFHVLLEANSKKRTHLVRFQ